MIPRDDATLVSAARCRNCAAVVSGNFCAQCGQATDIHVPTTREILHETFEVFTHSDSRLWRTLALLWFRPGKLTQEFVAGRRAAYLPPVRLYLVVSVVFFVIASLSHSVGETVRMDRPDAAGETPAATCVKANLAIFSRERWNARLEHACEQIVSDRGESLVHVVTGTMPKAMFLFLPLIAMLHQLLYWRPRHLYAEHLLFFIHLQAFFFSMLTVTVLLADAAAAWPLLDGATGILIRLLHACGPLYTVVAMKRVFGRSWPATLVKAVALFVAYLVVLGITVAGVFLYAMLQL